MDNTMDKYLGKRLEGRYEIQELIGMGGMANVYKAYDIIDARTVAVKILRDEFSGNSEFLRRFKNESKAIAVLNHPNIVRVYDVSFTGKIHSIVMEYIDGITLKDYIDQQGAFDWKEAVHFTLQILRALQHAHDKGIVHRDIKPHNIMLLQNGGIKVTDFGIARFARSEVKTITDRAIGSVHYISPEQAMGDNTDEKSDIYSVGVMLFEMLTGKLPFDADSPVSVAIKQIQTQAVLPTSLNPGIPAGLEAITVRAMQKDAANRYQSAAEMIADIERFKQDPSINFAYKYLDAESETAQKKKYRRAITRSREEDGMQQVKRKRTPYIPILTGVTFAFVLATLGFIGMMVWMNNPFAQVTELEVPALIGEKYDTVKNRYDFTIEVKEQVANSEYGNGVIIEQSPKAGRKVKAGGVVSVTVSTGQLEVTLPNFTGRDADEVFSKLEDLGLDYTRVPAYSADVLEGNVIYTDPSKDSVVNSGTVVRVYVSMGPEQSFSEVPILVGMSLDDAKRFLELSGLRLGEVKEEEDEAPEGTIIAQDPAPNSLQPDGATINITISKGSEVEYRTLTIAIPMPDIGTSVTLRATIDGETAVEETGIIPNEIGTWRPPLRGAVGQESTVNIYVDGSLYKSYLLDFETREFDELTSTSGSGSGSSSSSSSSASATSQPDEPEDTGLFGGLEE